MFTFTSLHLDKTTMVLLILTQNQNEFASMILLVKMTQVIRFQVTRVLATNKEEKQIQIKLIKRTHQLQPQESLLHNEILKKNLLIRQISTVLPLPTKHQILRFQLQFEHHVMEQETP